VNPPGSNSRPSVTSGSSDSPSSAYGLVLLMLCLLPLLGRSYGLDWGMPEALVNTAWRGPIGPSDRLLPASNLHTLLEVVSVMLALASGGLALGHYRMVSDPSLPIFGAALICTAAMDTYHCLATVGLISSVASAEQLGPFTWVVARTTNAVVLLCGVALACVPSVREVLSRHPWSVLASSGLGVALSTLALHWASSAAVLPSIIHPRSWLPRPSDLLPLAPLLGCAVLLRFVYLRERWSSFAYSLWLSLIPATATQLYMAFRSAEIFDAAFITAHALKALAYLPPMIGVVLEYRAAHDARERLAVELDSRGRELRETAERVEHDALHDSLTGLLNRKALQGRIQHAVAHAARYGHLACVLFVDFDRFQSFNEQFGDEAGNEILRQAGERLGRESRSSDVVGRYSSDEFVLVLYGARDQADVFMTAELLRSRLSRPFDVFGVSHVITQSIGVALYPHDANDAESLLRHAELAMRNAKRAGGDRSHFYEPAIHAASLRAIEVERDLRRAIDEKQFFLVVQPQLSLETGDVVGAEALLRWNHPERGMVSPLEFLPVAERTGLIVPIGTWVIHAACAERARWNTAGLPHFPIAVNVSAEQFRNAQVVDLMWSAIEEHHLAGNEIQCEVTESCTMSDAADARRQLERMRERGIRVSIDDFGTGYSSLSALAQFPIDVVKIDRSFVSGVTHDKKKLSIVSAIIALGDSLGLDTVAEGIETDAQRSILRELGCAKAQGYLFAKPMPCDAFATWVSARIARPKG